MADADAERKAKAARAKALLAKRQKEKAKASASPVIPSSPASTAAEPTATASARTSLSIDVEDRSAAPASTLPSQSDGPTPIASETITSANVPAEGGTEKSKEDGAVTEGDADPAALAGGMSKKQRKKAAAQAAAAAESAAQPAEKDDAKEPDAAKSVSPAPQPTTQLASPPEIIPDSSSKLQETISLLIAERADLQASLSTARRDSQLLSEGRSLVAQLEADKADLESKLEKAGQAEAQLDGLRTDLSGVLETVKTLQGEKAILQTQVDEADAAKKEADEEATGKLAEIQVQLERLREREGGLEGEVGKLRQANGELTASLKAAEDELKALKETSEKDGRELETLRSAHSTLQAEHDKTAKAHDELQKSHGDISKQLSSKEREFEEASAARQAAEKALSTTKAELDKAKTAVSSATKRAESAEKKRQALQEENADLVAQLEEVRGKVVSTQEEKVELVAAVESWETKSKLWEKSRAELEKQVEEGKEAQKRIATLELEVDKLKRVEAQHETLEKKHSGLQAELDQSQKALKAHEQTIADLQAKAPAELDSAKTNGHATANTDVESAVRAAHDLALSQREEKIRSLETELHASSSRVHALQRQLSDLQLAYAQSQAQSQSHSHLPPSISRPSSASHAKSYFLSPAEDDDLPNRPGPLRDNRSVDAALPASVRHKRQVSLSALKARMGIDAKSAPKRSPGLGNSLASLQVLTEEVGARNRGDKQFGDEIMFCCPACEGDLITL